MDQGPLVTEQINAGEDLIRRFEPYAPLSAAFWFKTSEDKQWMLQLVSDQINDTNYVRAYHEIIRLMGGRPQIWLELMQIKVSGIDEPVAKAVLEIASKYPSLLPMRIHSRLLGNVYVDDGYIYALPALVPA